MARILVAEDNAMLLGAIQDTLELSGYDVCAVRNGVQALEALSHFRPEVIVSDLAMPEMDGFELYRRVRRESPGVAILFIFISARAIAWARRTGRRKQQHVFEGAVRPGGTVGSGSQAPGMAQNCR